MTLPKELKINLHKYCNLRYGENPHQTSAFYVEDGKPGYELLWGIELSYNNIGDANYAWKLVSEFERPTVAIVKHANPSGITSRRDLANAFKMAQAADPVSSFGGIVALNRPPTLDVIEAMRGMFFELMVAPNYSAVVIERLKKRSAKMRVVKAGKMLRPLEFTRAFGGYLVQTPDDMNESTPIKSRSKSRKERGSPKAAKWKVVSGGEPSAKVYRDCEFAWKVVKHVKSNAIVVVKDESMVGMGTGQPNRVNSTMLALRQAQGKLPDDLNWRITKHPTTVGAVMASDAFFPFADNVRLAARAGILTIIQPGGSINDDKVIAEAKKNGITMIFTGVRHFKH